MQPHTCKRGRTVHLYPASSCGMIAVKSLTSSSVDAPLILCVCLCVLMCVASICMQRVVCVQPRQSLTCVCMYACVHIEAHHGCVFRDYG
jgi:hypothetical protein